MKRFLLILITLFAVSFFVFPVNLFFLPSQNTKNLLCGVGLVVLVVRTIRAEGRFQVDKGLLSVIGMACGVSLISFVAIVYNNTTDTTYVSYVTTCFVWLLGAYAVAVLMRWVHGGLSIRLMTMYLLAMCTMQCISALIIDNNAAFENFVIRFFYNGIDFYSQNGRMYGIGAGLDVAGVRFAGVLVITAHLCVDLARNGERRMLIVALLMFCFVTVVGNMIARTTTVGALLAFGYWGLSVFRFGRYGGGGGKVLRTLLLVLLLVVPVFTVLYNTNPQMRDNLRFGFEGFFSLAEKGHWETNSNNELKEMVKWPDNLKTWIIGDGYMLDESRMNPYYLKTEGKKEEVFYMGTDIGYCRFIFYFGLIGLSINILYFLTMAVVCAKRCPNHAASFALLFCINLIVWAKVSTDVFAVFVLLLMVGAEENALAEEEYEEDEDDEEEEDENEQLSEDVEEANPVLLMNE